MEVSDKTIPDNNMQNGDNPNPVENWEKRYKDTQSAFTKAQQEKIELAKKLVEKDATEVKNISDENIRKKILQDKWGVDSVEELEILFPEYNQSGLEDNLHNNDEEVSKVEKLEKEVKLMKLMNIRNKTNEELEILSSKHNDIIEKIPNFNDKIKEELKNISENLPPKQRVEKAFKLVANSNLSEANAYSILQGVYQITPKQDTSSKSVEVSKDFVKEILGKNRF